MIKTDKGTSFSDFGAVRLSLASAKDIIDWSHGEVLKPETINYRTQKPEKDGLFCEKIFGPVKDISPHDSRYKGVRSREAAVDKKGLLVTKAIVRRERMGHIKLATPVVHVWFLRGIPSPLAQVTGLSVKDLEKVTYFAAHLVLSVNEERQTEILDELRAKRLQNEEEREALEAIAPKERTKEQEAKLKETTDLDKEIGDQIALAESLVLGKVISENQYREIPAHWRSIIRVGMGGQAIHDYLTNLNLDDLIKDLQEILGDSKVSQKQRTQLRRLRALQNMKEAEISIEDICPTVLAVIPPDLRPIVPLAGGRFATSDLNDLYRRVINRNNRLKKLIDLGAPEVICRNEQRMLQEAVDCLIDNGSARNNTTAVTGSQRRKLKSLTDILKGKHGRLRQNLLGKRVDYSGRSAIVSGPSLSMEECGLPKVMALELFKPFIIGWLIEHDYAHNIRSAGRIIESGNSVIWDALDEIIEGKYVLLNRAPSLHRLSVQAFRPRLIEGKAIQLHPLVCKGFNADFDGDTMAVHLPLSGQAQKEAKELMTPTSNLLHPADGTSLLHLEQDIVLGLYYLTYEKDTYKDKEPFGNFAGIEEAIFALEQGCIEVQAPINIYYRGQRLQTTLGRVIFNDIMPPDFPFKDVALHKKVIAQVMNEVYDLYGPQKTVEIADKLKEIAFGYATWSGISIGMGDFNQVVGFDKPQADGIKKVIQIGQQYEQGLITDSERYRLVLGVWSQVDDQIQALVDDQFEKQESTMKVFVGSGSRGTVNLGQVKRMTAFIGLVTDTTGRPLELPVGSAYFSGLPSLEYFVAARGARKSLVDVALSTADSGYLTRRLVYVSQGVFTIDDDPDYPDNGFEVRRQDADQIGITFGQWLAGRYSTQKIEIDGQTILESGELITNQIADQIEASDLNCVKIRTAFSATNLRGLPSKSYGVDLSNGQLVQVNHSVGVIAAQSIGEPSTQLKLDSKHGGGLANITQNTTSTGLNRVEELLEARPPKGHTPLAEFAGTVSVNQNEHYYLVQIQAPASEVIGLEVDGFVPLDKLPETVKSGQLLGSDHQQQSVFAPAEGKIKATKSGLEIRPTSLRTKTYNIPLHYQLAVENGQTVDKGQELAVGSINLTQLLALRGLHETQRHILIEISKIFALEGSHISSKHLEIIINQMFSQVKIDEAGDSQFIEEDIISLRRLKVENKELIEAGKKPALYSRLILGITKVSSISDSFLVAASFQDTTRVLIKSSMSGQVDHLEGLIENVILGRKIPVGTGAGSNEVDTETESE